MADCSHPLQSGLSCGYPVHFFLQGIIAASGSYRSRSWNNSPSGRPLPHRSPPAPSTAPPSAPGTRPCLRSAHDGGRTQSRGSTGSRRKSHRRSRLLKCTTSGRRTRPPCRFRRLRRSPFPDHTRFPATHGSGLPRTARLCGKGLPRRCLRWCNR